MKPEHPLSNPRDCLYIQALWQKIDQYDSKFVKVNKHSITWIIDYYGAHDNFMDIGFVICANK
jgi:hypothetical protein